MHKICNNVQRSHSVSAFERTDVVVDIIGQGIMMLRETILVALAVSISVT